MTNTALQPDALPRKPDLDTKENPFAVLRHDLQAGRDLVDAIRTGFDAGLLAAAAEYFEVPAVRIRAITRVADTTAHRLVKLHARLDPAASERLWRLADVATLAEDVFEDESAAKHWLRAPNRTFLDVAPMDYLDTEPGATAVRQVLNAIATGGAV